MIRFAAFALLASFAGPALARAASLDDFLARGYTIAASTVLPGSFTGCVRQHRLVFADGSAFACYRTAAQIAYEPRVYILRLGGEQPSVVLVGSRVMAGQLLRLRLHDYPVPLRMNSGPLEASAVRPRTALPPLAGIRSINVLTDQQNAPLSQQQDRLPTRQSKNPPSR